MRPARRVRRALPLPNSVRASATRRKSATVVCSSGGGSGLQPAHGAAHLTRHTHVDHGVGRTAPSPGNSNRIPRLATCPRREPEPAERSRGSRGGAGTRGAVPRRGAGGSPGAGRVGLDAAGGRYLAAVSSGRTTVSRGAVEEARHRAVLEDLLDRP